MVVLRRRAAALLVVLAALSVAVLATPAADAQDGTGGDTSSSSSTTTTSTSTAPPPPSSTTSTTAGVGPTEATGDDHPHEEVAPAELGITSPEVGPAEADEAASSVPFLGTHDVWCTQSNPSPGICGGHHGYPAIDIGMPVGTTVNASGPGVVQEARRSDSDARGLYVTVRHPDGIYSRYLHLSAVSVVVGQAVDRGTPLGRSGNTGSSTSPHLHYDEQRPLGTSKELGTMIGWVGTEQVRYPDAFGTTDWRRVPFGTDMRNDAFSSPVPPTPRQWGGPALATGDFDGDGHDDLAAGVPGKDSGRARDAGAVTVVYGGPEGITTDGSQQFVSGIGGVAGVAETGDLLGAALAAGDFDGDGYDDLAVGAPGEDVNGLVDAGAVVVLRGSASGLTATGSKQRWSGRGVPGRAGAGDQFGAALAAGDFDGDGRDDLAVGAPGDDTGAPDAGSVGVAVGTEAGLKGRRGLELVAGRAGMAGRAQTGDLFGAALATGDLDGHGHDDLAVGGPGEDVGRAANAGEVLVVGGSPTGLDRSFSRVVRAGARGVTGTSERDDILGAAVAIGDVNGDGTADLVVGVPGEDAGRVNDGALLVVPGAPDGLAPEGSRQRWSGSAGSAGTPARQDLLGTAVAVGDVDGDGVADILAGIPGLDVGADTDAGGVLVLDGAPAVLTSDSPDVAGSAEPEDRLGRSVATGDFDGDGRDDLVVAAPTETAAGAAATGALTVVPGSDAGLTGDGSVHLVRGRGGLVGTAKVDEHLGGLLPPFLF